MNEKLQQAECEEWQTLDSSLLHMSYFTFLLSNLRRILQKVILGFHIPQIVVPAANLRKLSKKRISLPLRLKIINRGKGEFLEIGRAHV